MPSQFEYGEKANLMPVSELRELRNRMWLRRITAQTKNIPAMATLVHRLVVDGNQRQRLGTAARELYDRRFDIRHTVAAIREPKRAT